MNEFDEQLEIVFNLVQRKKTQREKMQLLSTTERITKLVELQEKYYYFLIACEQNGGRPIPEKWKKWYRARFESSQKN